MKAFALLLLSCICASAQCDVYLFMGQSNMTGEAPIRCEPSPVNQSRLFMLYSGQWTIAKDPTSGYGGAGVSPALWAADRLATLFPGHTIGIVNAACPGTYLWQWAPDYSPHSRYGCAMALARQASEYGTLRGIFWYQGEAETTSAASVHAYGPGMHTLFEALRADLGVPIVFVQIGPDPHDPQFPYWSAIQTVQEWISEGLPSWGAMVSAKDLTPLPGNPYHLDCQSEIILGQRMAQAMYQLLQ